MVGVWSLASVGAWSLASVGVWSLASAETSKNFTKDNTAKATIIKKNENFLIIILIKQVLLILQLIK